MRKTLIPAAFVLLSFSACTPDSFLSLNPTQEIVQGKKGGNNNTSTPDLPDIIEETLLKEGAKIHLILTKQKMVTATFEFPQPNTPEIVNWWYKWEYLSDKGAGVKSSYDKTLNFEAGFESTVLLYVQCIKQDGTKSNIILSGEKIIFNPKKNMLESKTF